MRRWRSTPRCPARLARAEASSTRTAATAACSACTPSTRSPASTSRPARSARGCPSAAGAALAARMQGSARRAFVLLSDAECNEGSVWEAAMFAAHHRLVRTHRHRRSERAAGPRLHDGRARPVADGRALAGVRLGRPRGRRPRRGRGSRDTIARLDTTGGPPHVLVAHTVFGKGVSFMEAPDQVALLADVGRRVPASRSPRSRSRSAAHAAAHSSAR